MTAQDELRRAISMMQAGDTERAAALLDELLGNAELDARGRAAAFVWLAESRDEHAFKLRCLEQALACEPDNRQIEQGLRQLRAESSERPPLPHVSAPEAKPSELAYVPQVALIMGGVNGPASGAFVSERGDLATTSYAVGSIESGRVSIEGAPEVSGWVVRRWPAYDLALIETPLRLARKPALAPATLAEQDSAFVAHCAGGARLRGALLPTDRSMARHWLRTNLPLAAIPDAGGNPLYDERGQLLGLLTRNRDAANNALAISSAFIAGLAQRIQRERQLQPDTTYCPACGGWTRARLFGGRSCELCGAAISAGDAPAQPEKLRQLYDARHSAPCPHCEAPVGRYRGRCLRCGRAAESVAAAGH